jgi:dTDP-4-dehydrorhamnose reductase
LVTGACGQLGGHLTKALVDQGSVVLGLGRRACDGRHGKVVSVDVSNSEALDGVLKSFRPTHIVHLAGVTSPVEAERNPARAWALNADVPRRLAEYATATGGWLLYPSSDFIWDGAAEGRYRESDIPRPGSAYGRTKVAGEQAVADAGVVARFSLLYGVPVCPRETTWTRWINHLERGDEITTFIDEFRTPLPLAEAARLVIGLGNRRVHGLMHVAGPEVLTPQDIVRRLADSLGVTPKLRPVKRNQLPGGITRPANMAMATTFGVIIPAYHGAETLQRSMISLARQSFSGALRVVVVVNDGRDDTFAAAQRFGSTIKECVVIRSSAGRANAFAAAESELPPGPRLYLDQDAVLSPDAISELANVLAPGTGVHFAAPLPRAVRPHSVLSRAFYRAWGELPYVRESPVTMGAYAVSAQGRLRWDRFPAVHSDDKWVRWHFATHERAVLRNGSYEIVLPEGVRELVRARRRYHNGNRELQDLLPDLAYPDDDRRHRGAVRSLVASPAQWPSSAVFLGVYSAAAVMNRYAG